MSNIMVIRSGINPDLVLGVSENNVVLQWIDLNNPGQQWNRVDYGPNCRLINVATGTGMAVQSDSEGAQVVVSGDGDLWNDAGQDTYQAIRLASNFDLNLNDPGSSTNIGTNIVVWGWSGGDPNELWHVQNYTEIPPYASQTVQVFGGGGSSTALMFDGTQYIVEHQGIPTQDPRFLFTLVTWSQGISFQNQASGEFVGYCGDNASLCQYKGMCVQALWTYGAISKTNWRAVRPWQNGDMNWNIFGNDYPQPGSLVGVWSWGGGEPNELWSILAPSATNPQVEAYKPEALAK